MAIPQDVFERIPQTAKISNSEDDNVVSAIQTVQDYQADTEDKFVVIKKLQDERDSAFDTEDPSNTPKKTNSGMLQEAIERLMSLTTVPSFKLLEPTVNPQMRTIIQEWIEKKAKEAGYYDTLTQDFGGFEEMYETGSTFQLFGMERKALADGDNEDNDTQSKLAITNPDIREIYFNQTARNLRNTNSKRSVDEFGVEVIMDWERAITFFPELEEIGAPGMIPGLTQENERSQTEEVEEKVKQDTQKTQFFFYWKLSTLTHFIIAGKGTTKLLELKGYERRDDKTEEKRIKDKEYAWMMGFGKNAVGYVPVSQKVCFPRRDSILGYGMLHKIYKLALNERKLDNKAISAALFNIFPIDVIGVEEGKAEELKNTLRIAEEQQARGEKGLAVVEFGAGSAQRGINPIQSTRSEPISGEYERITARIDQSVRRSGVNRDAGNVDFRKTQGQTRDEEEVQNQFVENILDRNSSSFAFDIKIIMDIVSKTENEDSDKIIRSNQIQKLTEETETLIGQIRGLEIDEGEKGLIIEGLEEQKDLIKDGITVGDAVKLLKDEEREWIVESITKSGVKRNKNLQLVDLQRRLAILPPGSKAQIAVIQEISRINGGEITQEDLGIGGQPGQPGEDLVQGLEGAEVTA